MIDQILYEALGVPINSSTFEIKQAYISETERLQGIVESKDQQELITQAYTILSDPKKRREYDEKGIDAVSSYFDPITNQSSSSQNSPKSPNSPFSESKQNKKNKYHVLKESPRKRKNSTNSMFGRNYFDEDTSDDDFDINTYRTKFENNDQNEEESDDDNDYNNYNNNYNNNSGSDIFNQSIYAENTFEEDIQQFELPINMKDLYNGKNVSLRLKITVPCPYCHGNGTYSGLPRPKCPKCQGCGKIYIPLDPAFPDSGTLQVCINCLGKGYLSQDDICLHCYDKRSLTKSIEAKVYIKPGSNDGDIVSVLHYPFIKMVLKLKKDKYFQKFGSDLLYSKEINLTQALLGCSFPIQHLNNKILLITTPKNVIITPNMLIKVPKKGFPKKHHNNKFGDLYVLFKVIFPIPQEITPQFVNILQQLYPPKTIDFPIDNFKNCILKNVENQDQILKAFK